MTCVPSWLGHLLELPVPVRKGRLQWYLDERLSALGARVRTVGLPAMPFVPEDRELVTARDSLSARAFAARCAERLDRGNP